MQDSLIPNTVFLIPLLEEITKLGGPVQLELKEDHGVNVIVHSQDDIAAELEGVKAAEYKVMVSIKGEVTTFECDTETPMSPFHEAWLCTALRRDLVMSGSKVTTKHELKEAAELYSIGIGHSPPPPRTMPESYLVAEAWLMTAQVGKRISSRRGLFMNAYDQISKHREELRQAELERSKREQEADGAALS